VRVITALGCKWGLVSLL